MLSNTSEIDAKNVWLLSAYKADSHKAWADWLVTTFPQIQWFRLELPGRFFQWRIRGNPLSWLDSLPADTPDLILATSMVDIATLKGLHPRLATVPVYYYFHENQFSYPPAALQVDSIEPQMVQLYGGLAAQRLLFNSDYNRNSFLEGVENLLKKMPDAVPEGVCDRLLKKSDVLPVVVDAIKPGVKEQGQILWNHRWEYDKAPQLFVDAMIALADSGIDFTLALLGARHSKTDKSLLRLRDALHERIVIDDKVSCDDYRQILSRASIVVSTAKHEFQGLSVLEAVSAGARPLVPDALCYIEQYDELYRYPAADVDAIVNRLTQWLTVELPPLADVTYWSSNQLIERWSELFCSVNQRLENAD